jgi:hypothetical protein
MEFIANLASKGNYEVILLVVLLSIAANFFKIVDFYESNRKRRVKDLYEAINSPTISHNLKTQFEEEIETEHFRIIHRIKISKITLDNLLFLHQRVGDKVSFYHLVRAATLRPCMENVKEPSYRISLSKIDKILACYNLFFGSILCLFALILMAAFLATLFMTIIWSALVTSTVCAVIGMFMLYEGLPLKSIKFINDALNELSNNV